MLALHVCGTLGLRPLTRPHCLLHTEPLCSDTVTGQLMPDPDCRQSAVILSQVLQALVLVQSWLVLRWPWFQLTCVHSFLPWRQSRTETLHRKRSPPSFVPHWKAPIRGSSLCTSSSRWQGLGQHQQRSGPRSPTPPPPLQEQHLRAATGPEPPVQPQHPQPQPTGHGHLCSPQVGSISGRKTNMLHQRDRHLFVLWQTSKSRSSST